MGATTSKIPTFQSFFAADYRDLIPIGMEQADRPWMNFTASDPWRYRVTMADDARMWDDMPTTGADAIGIGLRAGISMLSNGINIIALATSAQCPKINALVRDAIVQVTGITDLVTRTGSHADSGTLHLFRVINNKPVTAGARLKFADPVAGKDCEYLTLADGTIIPAFAGSRYQWSRFPVAPQLPALEQRQLNEIHAALKQSLPAAAGAAASASGQEEPLFPYQDESGRSSGSGGGSSGNGSGEQEPPEAPIKLDEHWNPWQARGGPPFPLDVLPPVIKAYAVERSHVTGADVSGYVMAALAGMSGAIDHRISLRPKKNDGYRISPLIRVLLLGSPSTRRSAPISDIGKRLGRLDGRDWKTHKTLKLVAEAEARQESETTGKKVKPSEVAPPRQRLVNDTTTEGLCLILSNQNCGCIVVNDEMSGWLASMGKYGAGKDPGAHDRSIWLKSFDGGFYIQNRVRGNRVVENLSASILGAIQTQRLIEMGGQQFATDGLLQRFLPIMVRDAADEQDAPDSSTVGLQYAALLERLDRLNPESTFHLDEAGRAAYLKFSHEQNIAATLPMESFATFCGKLPRALGSLALLFHLADHENPPPTIPLATLERARAAVVCLQVHAYLMYSELDGATGANIKSVAATLIRNAGKWVTATTIVYGTKALRGADNLQAVQRAVQPFVWHGWIRPWKYLPSNNKWEVNPHLAGRFEAEVKRQEEEHAALISRIEEAARKGST